MSKHLKTDQPTDADLKGNPMIGGAKGADRAQASADDLDEFQGENTIEGDIANDTNSAGGVGKDSSTVRKS
jgi:hypothetical protein